MHLQIETVEPSSVRARRDEIVSPEPGPTASPTERLVTSPMLVRLAARLGKRINDLTAQLSPETVRATKQPVIETRNADGSYTYTCPVQVLEGPRSR